MDYYSHVFSLVRPLPLDEFSFKKMRTWGQSKIYSCCFYVWCKLKRINRQRESKIPNTNGGKLLCRPSTTRITFGIHTLAKSRSARGASHQPAFMDRCLLLTRVWPVYLVDELSWVFYKKLLDRVAYGILSNINDGGATLGKFVERL